jgi:hypothetical protein
MLSEIKTRLALKALPITICASFLIAVPCQSWAQEVATVPANDVQSGRLSLIEENDYFASHDDRHYTQGLKATYLFGTTDADNSKRCDWMDVGMPFEDGTCKRKYEWTVVGQNLYTPQNLNVSSQLTKERPYGAWLYTGLSLLQEHHYESHNTLENFEIQGGVVGPLAMGAETQNGFHQLIGDTPSNGWNNQIHTEPGVVLVDERKWRFELPLSGDFAIDTIPEAGATVGNVFDYAEISDVVRIGQNLRADYGSNRIRPNLSGTGWFDKAQMDGPLGWYVFAGSQGRAVGRNLFLDGNTFQPSASVDKKPFVEDFLIGASAFWSDDIRADFTVTERTKEFYGQMGHPDRFGGIDIAFKL